MVSKRGKKGGMLKLASVILIVALTIPAVVGVLAIGTTPLSGNQCPDWCKWEYISALHQWVCCDELDPEPDCCCGDRWP